MATRPTRVNGQPQSAAVLESSIVDCTDVAAREFLKMANAEYSILVRESEWINVRKIQLKRAIYETERLLALTTELPHT